MGSIDDLSEVQMANLSLLMTIRDCVLKNALAACCQFGIGEDLGQFFTSLSHAQILAIIVNLGDECLFVPRQNLRQLLSLPLPLLAPVFAVHPPRPASLPPMTDAQAGDSDVPISGRAAPNA
jgi:hypothetical protein